MHSQCLPKTVVLTTQNDVWRLVAIMALWDWPRYCLGTKKRCFGHSQMYLMIGGYHGLVGLAPIWFGHKKRCFWHTSRCLESGGYRGLVALVVRDMVWAQKKVFWAHTKVFEDWFLHYDPSVGIQTPLRSLGPGLHSCDELNMQELFHLDTRTRLPLGASEKRTQSKNERERPPSLAYAIGKHVLGQ